MDEYKIFEDLNSKGLDLKIQDLVRNYLSKKINLINKDKNIKQKFIKKYEESLINIENIMHSKNQDGKDIFASKIERFFKNYIFNVLGATKKISEDNPKRMYNLYTREYLNIKIKTLDDIYNELSSINNYFEFCKYINSTYDNVDLSNVLYLINDIHYYPLIYLFYNECKKYEEDFIYLSFLVYIITYIQDIDIKKSLGKFLKDIKYQLTTNIYENIIFIIKYFENIHNFDINKIDEYIIDKLEHLTNILSPTNNKKFFVFLYTEYINSQNENKLKISYDNNFNIEHIIPQKINEDDSNIINLQNKYLNKYQNLAYIEKDINNLLKNHNYYKKKELISQYLSINSKNNVIKLTKNLYINHYKEISEEYFQNRANDIQNFIKVELKNKIINIYNKYIKN